jgi:exodeoxyribonuclease VII large subunit
VGALLQAGADALWARFGTVQVRGELAGFNRASSGHWYFSLKDDSGASALLRCAMFRRAALLVDFAPADGHRVQVRGRLEFYAPRGELQLVVEALERVGQGSLYEEFLRLRARLEAQGCFDAARKRTLAPYPRALGVVTSLAAAALHDVLTALARRAPQLPVIVYPCLVQGVEAPATIEAALRQAGARRECDTLLLVRGGGSLEDLWAFNDERVVRAVVASPIPVVCGVGHETDITLADLAADLRAPTPTAAAELAAPAREALRAQLAQLQDRLTRSVARSVQARAQGLDHRASRLGQPARVLLGQRQRLDALAHRLARAPRPALEGSRHHVERAAQRLRTAVALQMQRRSQALAALGARLPLLDPQRVLERGYALITAAQGEVVRAPSQLEPGQSYRVRLAEGAVDLVPGRVTPPGGLTIKGG